MSLPAARARVQRVERQAWLEIPWQVAPKVRLHALEHERGALEELTMALIEGIRTLEERLRQEPERGRSVT